MLLNDGGYDCESSIISNVTKLIFVTVLLICSCKLISFVNLLSNVHEYNLIVC